MLARRTVLKPTEGKKKGKAPNNAFVRDAAPADAPALAAIGWNGEAVHRDRVRDAATGAIRYLLVVVDGKPAGYAVLVLAQLEHWPKVKHIPQIIDLTVKEDFRGRGFGRLVIQAAEKVVRDAGGAEIFIAADPVNNPRAMRIYLRLGYAPLSTAPVEDRWQFTDSDGVVHSGKEFVIYLRKPLE